MIFGTDGIRGFAGSDLSAFKALRAAMAIGIFFKNKAVTKKVIVGKDTRRSGYMIENAIVSGLNAVGFNVLQIGPMPTPAVAFLSEDMRCDFAIMISASHNPYYDNGIKVFDANGFKLSEADELEIDKIFNDENLINSHLVIKDKIGSAKRIDDVIGRYIVHIKNSFPKNTTLKNLRIVLDCANGAAYKVAPAVFSELGADVITLACEPNGININDGCGALHPNILAKEVKRLRADIGFAFDGDADRLVVVDENGEIINGDILLGALSKEQKGLEDIVEVAKKYLNTLESIEENKTLLQDPELGELAKDELKYLEDLKPKLEEEIRILLLPKDPNDEKNIFLEIRAGTGGDEAALFVGDLFKAYARYAESKDYKIEIVSQSEGSAGGFKEIILLIKGDKAYSRLKYEGGTHRVQRVPATESQGRVHTSAITVAVMPEAEDNDIQINPNDLKIDVMRSSGHGGQSVNTTDSAVRITHIPTGLVVVNQDGKSQHKNKESALKVLKARLYEMQEQERLVKERESRKSQVGSGDRSERIRTYNYPQNRISDHRINLTLHRLDIIMQDGLLDEIIEPLIAHYQAEALNEANL